MSNKNTKQKGINAAAWMQQTSLHGNLVLDRLEREGHIHLRTSAEYWDGTKWRERRLEWDGEKYVGVGK